MARQNKELKRNMPLAEWLSRNTKDELVQMADLMGLGVPDSDSARKDKLMIFRKRAEIVMSKPFSR